MNFLFIVLILMILFGIFFIFNFKEKFNQTIISDGEKIIFPCSQCGEHFHGIE